MTGTMAPGLPCAVMMVHDPDNVLEVILLTAAPERVCVRCLAARARLRGKRARNRIGALAESVRFNAGIGLCCLCVRQRLTLGVAGNS